MSEEKIGKSDISRNNIINTAIDEFSEHGYYQTSIKILAQKAGISQGLMYNYFKSKENLLQEIFKIGIRDVFSTLTNKDDFKAYLKSILESVNENKKLWILIHSLKMQNDLKPLLLPLMDQAAEKILTELLAILMKYDKNYSIIDAMSLFASIDGIINHYLIIPNYPIEDVLLGLEKIYGKKIK